tara:strand:+ start:16 stop:810 length:795 start_codon:yes stop_codon:yes gene_type:complete
MLTTVDNTVDELGHGINSEVLIQSQNISLRIAKKLLLSDISLKISKAEIVTIIGPNGAGKTTLLRLLLGLIPFSSGNIYRKPNLRIGYLPQRTVYNPVLPLSVNRLMNLTGNYSNSQILTSLEETGVKSLKDKPVSQLSGGEYQRVMLARALLRNPELLVLDEPVQAVDYMGESELYNLIGILQKKLGCGVLMVSHNLHVVMASTDRVLCLNQHICCEGKPKDVTHHPEYLRLFGLDSGNTLALYSHKHDHKHHISSALNQIES